MNSFIKRITGIILILAAVSGLLFSLAGLIGTWVLKPTVTGSLLSDVGTISDALSATSDGLQIASDSLSTSIDSVTALQYTVQATADTINTTTPMVETMATLARDDLPATITATQTSLLAAQESAKIIDGVLGALNNIPFISNNVYDPPVPLNVALADVSASLEGLPAALKTIDQSLETSGENLKSIQKDINLMAGNISTIKASLEDAQGVVDAYQGLVSDMQKRANHVEERLPGWITLLAVVMTFIFLWLGVAQIGLFLQGWDLLHVRKGDL